MVLYIGIYIESDWLYHAEWVALSNGQSGSELAEYSTIRGSFLQTFSHTWGCRTISWKFVMNQSSCDIMTLYNRKKYSNRGAA